MFPTFEMVLHLGRRKETTVTKALWSNCVSELKDNIFWSITEHVVTEMLFKSKVISNLAMFQQPLQASLHYLWLYLL